MPAGVVLRLKRKAADFVSTELSAGEIGIQTVSNRLFFSTDGTSIIDSQGAGGGTGPVTRLATLNVPYTPKGSNSHSETVVLAAATASQVVSAWLAPGLDTDENTADMLGVVTITGTSNTGSVTFNLESHDVVMGPIKIYYQLLTLS